MRSRRKSTPRRRAPRTPRPAPGSPPRPCSRPARGPGALPRAPFPSGPLRHAESPRGPTETPAKLLRNSMDPQPVPLAPLERCCGTAAKTWSGAGDVLGSRFDRNRVAPVRIAGRRFLIRIRRQSALSSSTRRPALSWKNRTVRPQSPRQWSRWESNRHSRAVVRRALLRGQGDLIRGPPLRLSRCSNAECRLRRPRDLMRAQHGESLCLGVYLIERRKVHYCGSNGSAPTVLCC